MYDLWEYIFHYFTPMNIKLHTLKASIRVNLIIWICVTEIIVILVYLFYVYRSPALNNNKIKHCIFSTIKCTGEINTIERWTLWSFSCAQWISIWARLIVWHISGWYSVSHQVLASISLLICSVALMILSYNSFIVCTFSC